MSDTMQYRMTCAKYGELGHQLHHFVKSSKHSAEQSVIDANHKAEMDRYQTMIACAPYRVQAREVTEWADLYQGETT